MMIVRYIHSLLQKLIDREDEKFRNSRYNARLKLNGMNTH